MGSSKTDAFTTAQNQIADLAKALAHPARIAILEFLMQQPGCMCGDIVQELPLAQATISQHLKALKAAGIIQGDIEGTKVCYCISDQGWRLLQGDFAAFFKKYNAETKSKCC
jgi:DNA-binding transcriptional ArsR family regulator